MVGEGISKLGTGGQFKADDVDEKRVRDPGRGATGSGERGVTPGGSSSEGHVRGEGSNPIHRLNKKEAKG